MRHPTAAARRTALAAGIGTIVLAALLALIPRDVGPAPPEEVPRVLAMSLMFATPGVVGIVGVLRGRRAIVAAAGVLCLLQSVVAFSGVTLVFLAPALGFLSAATEPRATRAVAWHPVRVVLAVLVGIPVAWVLVRTTGIFGLLAVVVIAGLARARVAAPEDRPALDRWGAAAGIAVLGLVVAAWVGLFATVETHCWAAREGPSGLVYERRPVAGGAQVIGSGGVVATGCSEGELSLRGAALAVTLLGGAVAVAGGLPPRGRQST
jgi:hypothetical protein